MFESLRRTQTLTSTKSVSDWLKFRELLADRGRGALHEANEQRFRRWALRLRELGEIWKYFELLRNIQPVMKIGAEPAKVQNLDALAFFPLDPT